MFYRKKPVVIKAITFAEFIQYGLDNNVDPNNIVGGKPLKVEYGLFPNVHSIVQKHPDCYLIPTLEGFMEFGPNDMLITGVKGEVYPCKMDIFEMTYEPVF